MISVQPNQRRKRAGPFHSRPQDRRAGRRHRRTARSPASPSGRNSASSAGCSARSITTNISTGSSGCATTTSISVPSSTAPCRFDAATIERAYGELIETLKACCTTPISSRSHTRRSPRPSRARAGAGQRPRRRSTTTARCCSSAAAITGKPSKFRNGSAGASAGRGRRLRRCRPAGDDENDDAQAEKTPHAARQAAPRRGAAQIFPRHRQRRSQRAISRRARGHGLARPALARRAGADRRHPDPDQARLDLDGAVRRRGLLSRHGRFGEGRRHGGRARSSRRTDRTRRLRRHASG